jgi:alanyl-tRNA synthetase
VEFAVNKQLFDWCNNQDSLKISITPSQSFLHEVREWHCIFPDKNAAIIPCGGTHINTLTSKEKIIVSLKKENDQEFKMISKLVLV